MKENLAFNIRKPEGNVIGKRQSYLTRIRVFPNQKNPFPIFRVSDKDSSVLIYKERFYSKRQLAIGEKFQS